MRSNKMSLNSNKIKIQFLIAIYAPYLELYFGENSIKIGLLVPEILTILLLLKTEKYNVHPHQNSNIAIRIDFFFTI